MAKTYNKSKHFDLSYFQTKGTAFFDTLDFSETSADDIKEILACAVPDIEFYQCIFKDLDLRDTDFESKTTFSGCQFNGNTIFENCHFLENVAFDGSVFNGIANFNNVRYEHELSFIQIHTKPAKGGYFYFRGDEVKTGKSYYPNSLNMQKAYFETEVSFLGREFIGETWFNGTVFANKFWFTDCDIGLKTNISPKFECDGIKNIDMCYRILKDALIKRSYTIQSREIERLEAKILEKQSKENDLLPDNKPTVKQKSNLLTTEEAADYLKLKPNTLERWRSQFPNRLPFVKIGRTVKYRLEDLQAYISDNMN